MKTEKKRLEIQSSSDNGQTATQNEDNNSHYSVKQTATTYQSRAHKIFKIVKTPGAKNYRIFIGTRLASTKEFKRGRQAARYIRRRGWELIIATIVAIIDIEK